MEPSKEVYYEATFSKLKANLSRSKNKSEKGFGQTPLIGDRRGFMPPQLKTKTWIVPKEDAILGEFSMYVESLTRLITFQ